jgi:hypothetical protein
MGARVVLSLDDAIVSEVELTKPVTVVGRHPACDIVVDHPAISGRHMLFRIVQKTVYAEDLASTNGMKVNGIGASHQVVHHLDLIEVGRHKLHFFDDELLAGGVGNLESTVQTDFERTMMAAHVAQAKAAERPEPDLSRTQYIPRDPTLRLGAAQESVRTEAEAAVGLALRVIAGERPGEVIALKRGAAFFIARLSGSRPPKLNRKELGPGTHPIAPQDLIDVGGWSFEVIQAAG